MQKRKSKQNINNDKLILINRYAPSDKIIFSSHYRRKIEPQINYVDELPPFIKNRMNKRQPNKTNNPSDIINPHIIKPEKLIRE